MGFWPILQGLGGGFGLLGGLAAGGQGLGRILALGQPKYDDLIQPGAPGTGWNAAWINQLPASEQSQWVEVLNEWGRTPAGRAQAVAYNTQMGENAAAREYIQGRAKEAENVARASPGFGWMDTLAGYAPKYAARGEALGGKIEGIGDETAEYARKRLADPNVMSQSEMDAIVGRMIGSSNDVFAGRNRAIEQTAAARGLGPAAVAALREQNAAANYGANLQNVAEVAKINALNRAQMEQAALGALMGTSDIYGRAGAIEDTYGRLASGALWGATEGRSRLDDALTRAIYTEALAHQPLDYATVGDAAAANLIGQALREYGAFTGLGNLLTQGGMGMFSGLQSTLDRKAMMDAQGGSDPLGWAGLGIGTALGVGSLASGGGLGGLAGLGPFMLVSDVAAKKEVRPANIASVLGALEELPVSEWSYIDEPGTPRHIGPMAQDFLKAFGYGGDPTRIAVVDAFGVALACIKELARRVRRLEAQRVGGAT